MLDAAGTGFECKAGIGAADIGQQARVDGAGRDTKAEVTAVMASGKKMIAEA
jgi:hypothetical protein